MKAISVERLGSLAQPQSAVTLTPQGSSYTSCQLPRRSFHPRHSSPALQSNHSHFWQRTSLIYHQPEHSVGDQYR